jgi:hypothetical protein
MSDLDRIKAELAFYSEVLPLEEELEAARESRKEDPVRFQEAKQVFEEHRRFYRTIAQTKTPEEGTIVAPTAEADASTLNVGGI